MTADEVEPGTARGVLVWQTWGVRRLNDGRTRRRPRQGEKALVRKRMQIYFALARPLRPDDTRDGCAASARLFQALIVVLTAAAAESGQCHRGWGPR